MHASPSNSVTLSLALGHPLPTLMPSILRLAIQYIHHPRPIEDMALRQEQLPLLRRCLRQHIRTPIPRRVVEMDKRREDHEHIAPLVEKGRATVCAGDFAGEGVYLCAGRRVVEGEVGEGGGAEAEGGFVEDGGPLEGCGWVGVRRAL